MKKPIKKYKSQDIRNWKFYVSKIMRYETCGDWHDDGTIEVAHGLDTVETAAIAIHELVERYLLSLKGIGQADIDACDIVGDGSLDKGMYDKNPYYRKAHDFATMVEKEIIKWASKSWKKYDKRVDSLKIKWYKPK